MTGEFRLQHDVSILTLRRSLIVSLLVIGCTVLLINGWMVYNSWQRMLNEAQKDAHNLSQSVSRQTEDSFLPVELTLQDLRDRITLVGLDPQRLTYLHNLLVERKASLPQLNGLFVYDAEGNWVITSGEPLQQHRNNSDRAYFRYHQQHGDPEMLIGEVIHSRSTGDLVIPLSMRLNNRDGSFHGVLLATLRINYFRQIFGYYDLGDRGLLALMTNSGNILYASPFPDSTINRNISGSPLFTHLLKKSDSGTAIYASALDGIERVFGYASLKRYPLVVAVGYDKKQLIHAWLTELLVYMALCILLLSVIAVLGFLLLRNIGSSIRNQQELARTRDQLAAMNRTLQTLALVDSLTGLANRRQFDLYLDRCLESTQQRQTPLALLMVDVDSFKRFNDTYGHLAGDDCLRRIGVTLQNVAHQSEDLIARYGGEEFAVILVGWERDGALRFARAANEAIADLAIPHENSENQAKVVTVSIGLHVLPRDQAEINRQSLIGQADKALYQAKSSGRNRVEMV